MLNGLKSNSPDQCQLARLLTAPAAVELIIGMAPVQFKPQQLLALLEAAIRDAPSFDYQAHITEKELRWLGRAEALIEASDSVFDLVLFRTARGSLNTYTHDRAGLLGALHNAYARVELQAPTSAQDAFIPAGDTWNGYAALINIIQRQCDDLLVVDPYLDSKLFTDFAPHSRARMVRCLTANRRENHPGLAAAARRWTSDQIGLEKPVEVRYATASELHDRLIIRDGTEAWLISQSVKDIAKRSPASVSRADPELARLKAQHYHGLWNAGVALETA